MKPVPHGEPYAGKLHVRFDEGAGVPDNKGRPALLYTLAPCVSVPPCELPRTDAGGARAIVGRGEVITRSHGGTEMRRRADRIYRIISGGDCPRLIRSRSRATSLFSNPLATSRRTSTCRAESAATCGSVRQLSGCGIPAWSCWSLP